MKQDLVKRILKNRKILSLKEEYQKDKIKVNSCSLFLSEEKLVLLAGKNDQESNLSAISIFDLTSGKLVGSLTTLLY